MCQSWATDAELQEPESIGRYLAPRGKLNQPVVGAIATNLPAHQVNKVGKEMHPKHKVKAQLHQT
jgi:hypothetical protein